MRIYESCVPLQVMLPILQKIGVSETSEQGIEELYTFMKEHPGVDTAPYLARLSKDFSAFVDKGLQRLERRERAGARLRPPPEFRVSGF